MCVESAAIGERSQSASQVLFYAQPPHATGVLAQLHDEDKLLSANSAKLPCNKNVCRQTEAYPQLTQSLP